MKKHVNKILNCFTLAGLMLITTPAAEPTSLTPQVEITIIGTSDMHGHLTGWKYEDHIDTADAGFSRVATLVSQTRAQHENTLVIDNGDTIQGTILSDELFNGYMDKLHPVIEIMNYINYDVMTLGNHEFNFGIPYIHKLASDAAFPFISANIYDKASNENYFEPYIIKNIDGIKVGIIGLTIPSVPLYDSNKEGILDLDFNHLALEAAKYVEILETKENADLIVMSVHAGLDDRDALDDSTNARLIAQTCPDIDILLLGHNHETINETINGVLIAAPSGHREAVQFDITMAQTDGQWEVFDKTATIHQLANFASDPAAEAVIAYADIEAKQFLSDTIGIVATDFQPANEIAGLTEGYLQDTAVVDLINDVQLAATGADVSAAALFSSSSNLLAGEINYGDIFGIYKYPNTLVKVEVTGQELKNYMESSASFYDTYQDGDLTIGFAPNVKTYNYDMFQGVDYKIDISQPAGNRIVDLMFNGQPLADDQVLTLAINDYRYSGIGPTGSGIISGHNIHDSETSLRTLLKEHIAAATTISPKTDNNWKIIGNDWDAELRNIAVAKFADGSIDPITWPITPFTQADLAKQLAKENAELLETIATINDLTASFNAMQTAGAIYPRISNAALQSPIAPFTQADLASTQLEVITAINNLTAHFNTK
ncbi:bifunctional metallophosphatase/5'-nucleotidase [Candidatus Epulonipiscium viviparus]|uniref:bifunctional metallophosphatase/5'-nucleotidase n=1 Tax=Candidatus Epulonipiscium viviparus TaxID=420336 RepID=UPI002738079D|nr:5'-nucleotidase C-terminal domain-containing protein [Candidatus Epulopiscium viviparus]